MINLADPNSIRNVSSSVRNARSSISQNNSAYERSASSVSSSWRGEISGAFRDTHRRSRTNMSQLLRQYNDLSSQLNRLADAVRRAEAEEKRKAAAAMR